MNEETCSRDYTRGFGQPLRAQAIAGDDDWKKSLKENLEQEYGPFVKVSGLRLQGTDAAQKFKIVSSEIGAGPAINGPNYILTKFSPEGTVSGASGLAGMMQRNDVTIRQLQPGDEVCVIQVLVGNNDVSVRLATAQPRDVVVAGNSYSLHYTSQIRFEFNKGELASASVDDVKKHVAWALVKAQ